MLPRPNRIHLFRDFQRLRKRGRLIASPLFNCWVLVTEEPTIRFAFVVSTRIAKRAVIRNQIKRRMRASAQVLMRDYPRAAGLDFLVVAQPAAVDASYADIHEQFQRVVLQRRATSPKTP